MPRAWEGIPASSSTENICRRGLQLIQETLESERMVDLLEKLLGGTIAVFMAGSLQEMGLKLDLKQASHALRDLYFMVTALFWSFVIGPAFAILLASWLPLAGPYALGLILLGLAPCAPFVPLLAEKAGADLNYIAAYLLLAALGTLIILPIAIPILAPKLTADSWMIARPLLFFIALPLAIGICVRLVASTVAEKSHPIVKKITSVDIIMMLGIVLLLYWRDFLSAVGTYAIGAQVLIAGFNLRQRDVKKLVHFLGDLLFRDALGREVVQHPAQGIVIGLTLQIRRDELIRVGDRGISRQAKLSRGPVAKHFVAPGCDLEPQLFIVDEFGFKALFAFVEGGHNFSPDCFRICCAPLEGGGRC
jgi:BASS family bile acid:Na+ symporter